MNAPIRKQDMTPEACHLDRVKRYLEDLRRQGYFGKVILSLRAGEVFSIEENKVIKPNELEK